MKRIILASKSIDRREIFTRAEISFDTFVTNINEQEIKKNFSDPIELVKEVAKAKLIFAKNALKNKKIDAIIIAADTIVSLEGKIIGKAFSQEEAFSILKKLMGKAHKLITGIAITEIQNPKIIIDSETTIVEFLKLSDKEIWQYIKSNEWKGRAGAYSIGDKASLFISKIIGSSSNVIGLPMHKVFEILKTEFGLNLI